MHIVIASLWKSAWLCGYYKYLSVLATSSFILESSRQVMHFESSCCSFYLYLTTNLSLYSSGGIYVLKLGSLAFEVVSFTKTGLGIKVILLFNPCISIGPTLLYRDGRHADTELLILEIAN